MKTWLAALVVALLACDVFANASGDTQRWNFHEYLLDRQVRVVASFRAEVSPQDERPIMAIEVLL